MTYVDHGSGPGPWPPSEGVDPTLGRNYRGRKEDVLVSEWVKIHEISSDPRLSADDRIRLTCVAMSELAIAQSMRIIHGDRRAERYKERGGCVRFDEQGDPCLPIDATERL